VLVKAVPRSRLELDALAGEPFEMPVDVSVQGDD
jgi:hypothetical protein